MSVSSSTNHDPPSGSATWATFVSWAMICCVRRAIARRLLCRQRHRLVHRVGVQALRTAEHPGERLDRRAHDVQLRLLRGQRHARSLGVEAQHQRAVVGGAVAVAQPPRPDPPGGPVLGDLLEEVDVGVEEERQPRREGVNRQPRLHRQLDVGETVGQRERQLLRCRCPRLTDVVAGDRDRMPARHLCGGKPDRVAHQPHRRPRREHELLLRLVLLQDVVLQRATEPSSGHSSLLRLGDEHRHDHRRRRVDRHRRRGRPQVDPRVEVLHVGEAVDRHPTPADLAERHRVIGVDPQQRRHVERRRQPVASRPDDLLEPPVRVLRGAEPGEHPHRPQLRPIHRRVRTPQVRELPRVLAVIRSIRRLERDTRHRREIDVTKP